MCKSCIDYVYSVQARSVFRRVKMDYFSNKDFSKGQCCLEDCYASTAVTKPPSYQTDGVSQLQMKDFKYLRYYMCPIGKEDYKQCGQIDGKGVSSKTVVPNSDGSKSKWTIPKSASLTSETSALCLLGIRQPSNSQYDDTLTVEVVKQTNADIHFTLGTMSTTLSDSNKAFTFRSTNVGVKSLAMPYPKVIYLSIEPIGKSGQNVDLEINYWFTNNHQSSSSSSSSSSDSKTDSKSAKS